MKSKIISVGTMYLVLSVLSSSNKVSLVMSIFPHELARHAKQKSWNQNSIVIQLTVVISTR